MKCRALVTVGLATFTLLGVACGGDDSGGGSEDASPDTVTPQHDSGTDATIVDGGAPDTSPIGDAHADVTVNDAGADAADASDANVNDANVNDASDGSIVDAGHDANDGAIVDASGDAGDASDAADAADASPTPITCTPLPTVGSIYYSRQGLLPDGGPKTDGEMWLVKGDGSSDTLLGIGEHPRISPDGKHILYFRDAVDYYSANVYVRDLAVDSGATFDHLVVTNQSSIGGADWRSDSASFVFDYGSDIYFILLDGSPMQKLVTYRETDGYTDYPVVSPADGRIAWHNFYDGLGIADATGANAAHVPNTFAGAVYPQVFGGVLPAADMFPAWSHDGATLAFLRIPPVNEYVPGTMGTPYKIQPSGVGRTYLTPGLNPGDGFFGGGVISQDGTYYINAGIYGGVQDMYAVPLDGSGVVKRVCTTPGAPIDFVGSAVN